MVTTSGGTGGNLPFSNVPRSKRFLNLRSAPHLAIAVILLLLLVFGANRDSNLRPKRPAIVSAFAATILLAMLGATWTAAGCGGGASGSPAITTPPQIVTPQ